MYTLTNNFLQIHMYMYLLLRASVYTYIDLRIHTLIYAYNLIGMKMHVDGLI